MDRIDDAYNGLMGEEFMRKTRERLHWVCSRVDGDLILDVGCSQGVVARLLAPLGKFVLGVDVNKDAVAYAESKLGEIDESSRGRLRFVVANFLDFSSDERFDTVIMGEVLEHLPDPAAFVKKAWSYLSSGGTIVITVPFGINDDPDHKQTFYWTWIKDFVAPLFDISEIEFFGKWIGVVGKRRERTVAVEESIPLKVVKKLEKAFYAIERPLVNDNKARGLRFQTQKKEADEAKKNHATIKNEVLELRISLDAEKKISAGVKEQISVLNSTLQLVASRTQNDANETKLLGYLQEVRELRIALESKCAEAVERAERIGNLEGQVDALKAEKELMASRVSELSSALASAQNLAKAKSAELAAKDIAMKEVVRGKEIKISELEKESEKNIVKQAMELKKLKQMLEKSQREYSKLAKSKLGRLTLKWWRVKDRIKRGGTNGCVSPVVQSSVAVQKAHEPLQVESWEQQRKNEKRYFQNR